ncbi:MAG TPA: hypothetical protein DGG95_00600 [Cytophagales bacterium]|jgi:putative transcriptional regulator|nr:hypothetical protein [Cytophagales bacterium]
MDFFEYKNKVSPQAGRMLISEPYLADPNFERTIIFICEHNHEGTVGFVLNKPSLSRISELISELPDCDCPVGIGGPVQQDTLHYIHRCETIANAVEVCDGIYWGGDFEEIIEKISAQQIDINDIKFFLGYSGWSQGQLEDELKQNSWIVNSNINSEIIFQTEPDQMWKKTLREMGGRFSMYANYPVDPSMN